MRPAGQGAEGSRAENTRPPAPPSSLCLSVCLLSSPALPRRAAPRRACAHSSYSMFTSSTQSLTLYIILSDVLNTHTRHHSSF